MRRHHKIFLGIGAIVFLAGWLAWSFLLTESELAAPPAAEQAN